MRTVTILAPKGGTVEEEFRAITNESGILSVVEIFRSNEVVHPLANFEETIVVGLTRGPSSILRSVASGWCRSS